MKSVNNYVKESIYMSFYDMFIWTSSISVKISVCDPVSNSSWLLVKSFTAISIGNFLKNLKKINK